MTITGINNNVSSQSSALQSTSQTNADSTDPVHKETTANKQQDTVKLSNAALAKSLKLEGETPAQIAKDMGTDLKTVDEYLGIDDSTTTTSTATTKAAVAASPATTAAASGSATGNASATASAATQSKS